MSRILLTGATGFLGSHLARALVRSGHEVVATVRRSSSLAGIEDIRARLALHDLDSVPLAGLFAGPRYDAIFHVATHYGRGGEVSAVLEANTLFPLRLLEHAVRATPGLFVAADTCFTLEYKHLQPYTLSKRQFAEWGRILAGPAGLPFVNLKLQNIYGTADLAGRILTMIVRRCLGDGDIELTAGEQRKDFLHVDDACRAFLTLLENRGRLAAGVTEFDCGSGRAVSVREIVETVHRLCESRAVLRFGALPYRDGEIMFSQAETAGLAELGWSPRVTLEEGIRELIEEWRGVGA